MTTEELALRGAITMLPQADQIKIFDVQTEILSLVNMHGDIGFFAFTLASLKILEDRK